MASRENQGLQIATIVVSVLAVIFAVTTYVFYAQSTKNLQGKEQADAAAGKARTDLAAANHKVKALQYVIGDGGVTLDQVNESKPPAGDPETDRIIKAFSDDMLAFGDAAGAEGPRNYRTLPVYLLSAISNKNTSLVTANNQATEFQKEKDNVQTTEQQRAAAAEAAVAKAQEELKTVSETSAADLDAVTKEREKLAAQLVAKDKATKAQQEEANKQIAQLQGQITTIQTASSGFQSKLAATEAEQSFDNPDGSITWVNQKQRLAWINVGRADGLVRQATFSVFDPEANGLTVATAKKATDDSGDATRANLPKPKGSLEVVRIIDEHLAECRIIGDSASNPILPNDIIYSPLWSPGQQIHFALAGFMDIDGDGISDRELIRNIITMNNGVIDAELKDDGTFVGKGLDVNTRYLVEGARPTEKNAVANAAGSSLVKEFTSMIGDGQRYGTETLSVQKLLVMTGWKAQEQTTKMGGTGAFKRRTPGGAKAAPAAAASGAADAPPAAVAPAAATPATATEAEPAAAAEDPFK